MDALLKEGRIREITQWLNQKIHWYGSTRRPGEVISAVCGRDTANAGKTLSYSVFNGAGADISAQNRYANGYLLTGFEKAEESVTGTLKLDQNQLYGVDLSSWAGNYQGTINFFSRIASLDDYK